ncbi:MAG: ribonuclease HII [Balneolaceae bacterium]
MERSLWKQGYNRVMGLDEAGRGCLCGPVVAAGVILDPHQPIRGLRDSKKVSQKERERMEVEIQKKALFWTVQRSEPEEIDRINILRASLVAMDRCSREKTANPDFLLIDGNRFGSSPIPYECVIGGDDKSASIAAASILAKVSRDRIMTRFHESYPHYGWNRNVGYPTAAHYKALQRYGYTPLHRKTFKLRTDRPCSSDNPLSDKTGSQQS